MVLQPATGHHFFLFWFKVFSSYFGVVGRSHKFAFTEMHDLSLTTDVIDVDPKMAFDVASHGLAAGHATPGLDVVTPGLLGWFFFNLFLFFHGFFVLFRAWLLLLRLR